MLMIFYILVYLALIVWIFYLLKLPPFQQESFRLNRFLENDNAEFRGLNMLGTLSNGLDFPCKSVDGCRAICNRNPECNGYSFYKPGNQCMMFTSGNVIKGRPGFYSGQKIKS